MVFDAKSDTIDPPWPSKTAKQSNFGEIFSIKYLRGKQNPLIEEGQTTQ
jgi:hypothetical protein